MTFNLPADLLRRAKVYAAEHETTVNALVRELLSDKLTADERAKVAAERFLELAEEVGNSPVDPRSIRREELYERC